MWDGQSWRGRERRGRSFHLGIFTHQNEVVLAFHQKDWEVVSPSSLRQCKQSWVNNHQEACQGDLCPGQETEPVNSEG